MARDNDRFSHNVYVFMSGSEYSLFVCACTGEEPVRRSD